MKIIAKVLLLVTILSLALSLCSCGALKAVTRDLPRVISLTEDIADIVQNTHSKDEAIEKVSALVHPKSTLTKDSILEQLKANEKLAALEISSMNQVTLGSFSTPKFNFNDKELGGNVYEVSVVITVAGQPFDCTIKLLSDDTSLGIYSFDIK
jgi:hypothetical protein